MPGEVVDRRSTSSIMNFNHSRMILSIYLSDRFSWIGLFFSPEYDDAYSGVSFYIFLINLADVFFSFNVILN